MKATVRRYLRAAGSILDIAPSARYSRLNMRLSDYHALSGDYLCIASDFSRIIPPTRAKKNDD